jgi:hypothetical protein
VAPNGTSAIGEFNLDAVITKRKLSKERDNLVNALVPISRFNKREANKIFEEGVRN